MAESARSVTNSHKADTKADVHVRKRDASEVEVNIKKEIVAEVVQQTGADGRPRNSQPRLQQNRGGCNSGVNFVTQSAKRKTEVFTVRARRGRVEGRQWSRTRNPGRRREIYETGQKKRDREEARESRERESEEKEIKSVSKEGDGSFDQVTRSDTRQSQQSRSRNRDRQREGIGNWRERGRGAGEKKTENQDSVLNEETSLAQSDNPKPREANKSRNQAKKREVFDREQQRTRRAGKDGDEKFTMDDYDHSNSSATVQREGAINRNRRRAVDRNWREKLEENDEKDVTSSTLPSGGIKTDELESVNLVSEKLSVGGEQVKKKKKSGQPAPKKSSHSKDKQVVPTLQSSELTQQLSAGTYSCMVCCDRVRSRNAVWSCKGCYHVFHLDCIRKWATSPASLLNEKDPAEGWRCPACQNGSPIVPTLYKCYCGKLTNPRPHSKGDLTAPHSCGDLCRRNLAKTSQSSCQHKCQLLCHPGPCPPCPVMVTRSCPCGRQSYQVRCSKTGDLPSCGSVCGRKLACGRHRCDLACHAGSCPACQVVLIQQCHCGRSQRDTVCKEEGEGGGYECGRTCGKELNCGNHLCELTCHPSPCLSCALLPSHVTSCPCGATPLSLLLSPDHSRTSCLDPVPTCGCVCGKRLPCSTRAGPHFCPAPCHEGSCPPCEKSRVVWCRCGKGNIRVDCSEVKGMGEYVCEKPCNKMKSCGRHRCNNRCCMDSTHQCDLVCGKRLQCGNHFCTEGCHKGHCDQCWEYSYEELICHCGGEVIYPPIACGTKPPACNRLCARMHACEHTVTHSCHNEEECPPCTFLTVKMCMGGHERRHNIPCHIIDVSCGMPCSKQLPCKNHKCQKTCHRGVCMDSVTQCKQPCQTLRKYCSHVCGEPCHVGSECPDIPCKAEVVLTCKCGRRKERVMCGASSSGVMQQAFHKILSKDLGAKIRDLQSGQSVSLGHVTLASLGKDGETLNCDEVCLQVERNRALAAALGISSPVVNPLEPSLPRYSDALLELARKDPDFASSVEEELRLFVEMVMKGSATQVRRHRFSPMFSNERKLIHELAPHYGCDSLSHDTEPQRYVTLSTKKPNAKLPSVSLTKMLDRERGTNVAPTPVNLPSLSVKCEAESNFGSDVTDYFADDLKQLH